MSTRAIREALRALRAVATELGDRVPGHTEALAGCEEALREVEAIEAKARDLTRLSLGDYVYNVRDSAHVLETTPTGQSTWEHPDVKAWGDAAELMAAIARQKEEGK